MYRGFVLALSAAVALAQIPPPKQNPVQAAIGAYWDARNRGQFEEAAAARERARSLLDQIPADAAEFGNSVRNVTQLYQNSGRNAQALAVAQAGLARTTALVDRIQLLQTIADLYQQERNLLQAVAYREKLVAALDESAAKSAPAKNPQVWSYVSNINGRVFSGGRLYSDGNRPGAYRQLADLYQQVGRPDAVAAIHKRMLALLKDPAALASYYYEQGDLDAAAAIYKKQAEQLDPSVRSNALQGLANIYQQEQRFSDAADVYRQAIAAVNASDKPEVRLQSVWMRSNLATSLKQAGQLPAADQVYEQLLAETLSAEDGVHLNVLNNYANFLTETNRDAQAQAVLSDYLANHGNLQPQQQASLQMQLSYGARRAGDGKRADDYQRAGMAMQRASQPPMPPQILIGEDLQGAQRAVHDGRYDDAFALSLQAMDDASPAADRDGITWQVPNIATELASKKQPEKADRLYQRLLGLVDSWSVDSPQPLIGVLQNYSQFLLRGDRWNEAPAAIRRYRDAVTSTRGAFTGMLVEVYRLVRQFETMHGSREAAIAAAKESLALNESLSGSTSEPFLAAAEELAQEYKSAGDNGRAAPLLMRNVAIADLALRPSDGRRAGVRISAAFTLAQLRQFDEAEKLAAEAVAIGQAMRPQQGSMYQTQLEQIRNMRVDPMASPGARSNPWFQPGFQPTVKVNNSGN